MRKAHSQTFCTKKGTLPYLAQFIKFCQKSKKATKFGMTKLGRGLYIKKFKPVLLNQFNGLSTEQKIANLEYFLLEFGTYTSVKLSAAFFDKTPQPDIKDLLVTHLIPILT